MTKYDEIQQEIFSRFDKNLDAVVDEKKLIADIALELDCSSKMVKRSLKLLYDSKKLECVEGEVGTTSEQKYSMVKNQLNDVLVTRTNIFAENLDLTKRIDESGARIENLSKIVADADAKLKEFQKNGIVELKQKESVWLKERESLEAEIKTSKETIGTKDTEIETLKSENKKLDDVAKENYEFATKKEGELNELRNQQLYHVKPKKYQMEDFEKKQLMQTVVLFAVIILVVAGGSVFLYYLINSGFLSTVTVVR